MAQAGVTRRVFIVAVGRTASTASVFIVYAILARTWPGEQFGVFTAVWVLGNTLVPFFLLGLPTGLLYFFPRRDRRSRQALVLQAALCLAVSGLAAAVVLLSAGTRLASIFVSEAGGGSGLTFDQYLVPFIPYVFSLVAGGYGGGQCFRRDVPDACHHQLPQAGPHRQRQSAVHRQFGSRCRP